MKVIEGLTESELKEIEDAIEARNKVTNPIGKKLNDCVNEFMKQNLSEKDDMRTVISLLANTLLNALNIYDDDENIKKLMAELFSLNQSLLITAVFSNLYDDTKTAKEKLALFLSQKKESKSC